jgi:preprotein translocase subunit SecG
MSIVIGVLTFILVLTSLFLVMIVLMQRAKTDGGIGAAMAGGATESAFGAETNNVLSGATIKAAIVFFVLSFGLFLANIHQAKNRAADDATLPTATVPASATPAPAPALDTPLTTQPEAPKTGEAKP